MASSMIGPDSKLPLLGDWVQPNSTDKFSQWSTRASWLPPPDSRFARAHSLPYCACACRAIGFHVRPLPSVCAVRPATAPVVGVCAQRHPGRGQPSSEVTGAPSCLVAVVRVGHFLTKPGLFRLSAQRPCESHGTAPGLRSVRPRLRVVQARPVGLPRGQQRRRLLLQCRPHPVAIWYVTFARGGHELPPLRADKEV